jgi:hypothetical protein
MSIGDDDDQEDFAVDSVDPALREDDKPGPPDNWQYPSWYRVVDRTIEWWWRDRGTWRPDPCPARALGMREGDYIFITAFGEIRHFTSGQLHGRGGIPDLFVGERWWRCAISVAGTSRRRISAAACRSSACSTC